MKETYCHDLAACIMRPTRAGQTMPWWESVRWLLAYSGSPLSLHHDTYRCLQCAAPTCFVATADDEAGGLQLSEHPHSGNCSLHARLQEAAEELMTVCHATSMMHCEQKHCQNSLRM